MTGGNMLTQAAHDIAEIEAMFSIVEWRKRRAGRASAATAADRAAGLEARITKGKEELSALRSRLVREAVNRRRLVEDHAADTASLREENARIHREIGALRARLKAAEDKLLAVHRADNIRRLMHASAGIG